ncbi:helix-turn-helix domain-containing protein [Elizabethkingia sp. JS20170427COW]|uniref:helix-turn-helix domain-containing protein n=1 Tax=Elizabethkingia sp. JS20170427COW TaxID=2583851 RepID=UPI0011108A3D|nr:XRE family transcriptional regulator [Elizabethkingia sp. JS20170427COW]QCX52962.1 helix-turn-helix domain-containing protein [Elizabethkingia sp. JS20170427COW]
MTSESDFIKTIFGLKLKQLRQKKNWSLQDLSDKTKLSKSYLNEIENGKKYPKHDKILQLSEVLNCKFDDLVSTKLDKNLAPFGELLQSDFFKEIPLELFGINKNTLINIMSEAPKQVTAFINTLIEISQNYNLGKERFYFAVLRSFQELHDNYFPEIEEKAQLFVSENNLNLGKNIDIEYLQQILIENFGYEIKFEDFENYGTLGNLRSLYIPEKNLLLLNKLLDKNQRTFILAKEIGFNVLGLNPRPNTYSWVDFSSFKELLNNFYASYFAGCILIPNEDLIEKLEDFFDEPKWSSQKLTELIAHFTNSPETFYYRLTNILPSKFGIKDLFYLCFVKKKDRDKVQILKELHLNQQQAPHANSMNEHYCQRWIAIKNLQELKENETLTSAQISHYNDSGSSYLVLSTSHKNPFSDGANRSYCIGILLNSTSLKKIKFAKSTSVKSENVGITCETCNLSDCEVRKSPPIRLDKENFNENMKKSIAKIRRDLL